MTNPLRLSRKTPIWITTILISLAAFVFLVYLSFQISLFPESSIRKVYYVDNISEAHLKIIRSFNELYKGRIEVVPVSLPFNHFTTNDRKEILARSLRSRSDGVDIFAVDVIWIPRFAKWGYPMNLRFDEGMLRKTNEMALQACVQNDSLVAFPLFLDVGVLYYRKDLISALDPTGALEQKIQTSMTWEEFLALGRRYPRSSAPFYVFPGGSFEGMLCCFHEMLSNDESEALFHSSPINLNAPPARRALGEMVDLIHTYKLTPFEVTRFDDYTSYMYATTNNAVFLRGWVGYHKQYRNFLKDTSNIANMALAPLPHFSGHTSSGVFGGWSLMISRFSSRKEEALKFISYMFQKENQEILYEDGGYLPINTEVYADSAYLARHKELVQIQRLMSWGKHRPFLENYTRLSEIMSRNFHKALKNELSVAEALERSSVQINNESAGGR